MDDLHRVRLSALPGSIVHDCGARLDGMGEHGRVRYGLPMMRDDPQIDGADAILRAHQVELLVPGEIAEMQHPKFSKSDVASDRLRILGFVHLLRSEAGTVWIRLSCARRARPPRPRYRYRSGPPRRMGEQKVSRYRLRHRSRRYPTSLLSGFAQMKMPPSG